MRFGPVSVHQAEGKILAHNLARADGRQALRKGRKLSAEDISALLKEGYYSIYVAELEPGDLDENSAARRAAEAAMGIGLHVTRAAEGRANLVATAQGVLRVDDNRLEKINELDGVTFATLRSFKMVEAGQTVATVKIIPYSLPSDVLDRLERITGGDIPLIQVSALKSSRVGLVLSGLPLAEKRVRSSFEPPLRKRIEALGSRILAVDYACLGVEQDEETVAETLLRQIEQGIELIIMASETSTMDHNDITPRALEAVGGEVICVGAPIEPGNLLLLAYVGDIPVIGVPGCARSQKANVIDYVLPALLAGDRLTKTDIARMGYGGLIDEASRKP